MLERDVSVFFSFEDGAAETETAAAGLQSELVNSAPGEVKHRKSSSRLGCDLSLGS